MKKFLKQKNGITLIALVITIIVLIILATVTINIVINGGLFSAVKEAKFFQANAEKYDQEKMEEAANSITELAKIYSNNSVPTNLTETDLANINSWNTNHPTDTISELTGNEITNNYLNNTRIKAVLTGQVPLTTEMTYIEGSKDTGLVVSIDDSEFVWVPVNNINDMVMCKNNNISGHTCNLQIVENSLTCTASGASDELCGKLYALSTSDPFDPNLSIQKYTFNDAQINVQASDYLREPALVPNYDTNSTYNNGLFTLDTLNTDFTEMSESVARYKGFYVARYELGIENGQPVSKNAYLNSNVTTADAADMWYGLYQKEKSMFNNIDKNVQSTMIWGCQYDAMIKWMGSVAHSSNTTLKNTDTVTGKKEEDKINNVYDLYGCHSEWTLEADDCYDKNDRQYFYLRIARGGDKKKTYSPDKRRIYSPAGTDNAYSSRPTIHIKY